MIETYMVFMLFIIVLKQKWVIYPFPATRTIFFYMNITIYNV